MRNSWTSTVWELLVRFFRAFMLLALLAACDSAVEPNELQQESPVFGTPADQSRINEAALMVTLDPYNDEAPEVELVQVGFVQKPRGLSGSAGATSTSFFPGSNEGLFATVYNTAGTAVGGAISTMSIKKGKLKVDKDVKTSAMEFAEARLIEEGKDLILLAAGTGVMDGSLDLTSEAIFMASDLKKFTNVFDLPSGWAMGFDFVGSSPGMVVVATAPTGSLSFLDPLDPGRSVTTVVDGQPAFLGLATHGEQTLVTDVTGVVRSFASDGMEVGRWSLGGALNVEERAEVSACSEATVVGAHTNGVLVRTSGVRVAAEGFGLGASILADCSAYAATTEDGVVVGLRGPSEYFTYTLRDLNGSPLPYANSVEILEIPEDSPMLGGRWEAEEESMLLLVLSSAEGTHFIEIRMEEDD